MAGSRTEIAELAYCTLRRQTAFLYQTEHTPIPLLFLSHSLKDIQKLNIEAFVAGSDQIWRYGYVPDKRLFFYSFASPEIRKRSIAYAACLGVDTWEWPQALTDIYRPLAQEFKALSVREESGISLCAGRLGVEARWMPDPTFLLNREEYRSFIRQCQEAPLQKPADYIAY